MDINAIPRICPCGCGCELHPIARVADPLAVVMRAKLKRDKANKRRRERDQVMKDLGLTKVCGSISGRTYWE
jgi:hypothetical protein